jgi:hypothetical protein
MPHIPFPYTYPPAIIETAKDIMDEDINDDYTFTELLKLKKDELRSFHTHYIPYRANSHLSKKELLLDIFLHRHLEHNHTIRLVTNYVRRFIIKLNPERVGSYYEPPFPEAITEGPILPRLHHWDN